MKRFVTRTCLLPQLAALLAAQLSQPQPPGMARFADGSIHVLHGIAANFMVDAQAMGPADRASFSSAGGLTSAQGAIRLMDAKGNVLARYQSDEATPLLNIDSSLQTAVVWLPSKHVLLTWNGASFSETTVDDAAFGGQITFVRLAAPTAAASEKARAVHYCALEAGGPKTCSARPSNTADRPTALAATADFFVLDAHASVAEAAVSLPTARLLSRTILPGVHSAVFVQQGWLLFQDGGALLAQLPDGDSQTIQLSAHSLPSGDLSIERMSDNWLHVSSLSTGQHWAVLLQAAKWSVSLLPPPMPEEAK